MKHMTYQSGEEIRQGDRITYGGASGEINFVLTEKCGDPELDWYLEESPEGGCMATVANLGNVFLTDCEADEDLKLIARQK